MRINTGGWGVFTCSSEFVCKVCEHAFLCPSVVKASEVGARSAVIAWKASTVVYHSYRLIYQVAGEETKVNNIPSSLAHAAQREPLHLQNCMLFCVHIRR